MTPTARTLAALRADGWLADKVEQRIARINITRDLFGVIDILAIRGAEVLGVQATSRSNVAARLRKIAESEATPRIREAGIRLEVWGWGKMANGRWECRKVDAS